MIKSQNYFAFSRSGEYSSDDGMHKFPFVLNSKKEIHSTFDSFLIRGESADEKTISTESGNVKIWESQNFFILSENPDFIMRSGLAVKRIINLKRSLGYSKLLYIPGISDPYLIPVWMLLGVDVFDDINAIMEGSHAIRYTMFGRAGDVNDQTENNISFLEDEVDLLARSIENGTFFNVVERFNVSPKSMEIIRHLETIFFNNFEKNFPRYTPKILAGGLDSMRRPDVKRFNSYIQTEYSKKNMSDIALFIPCSARKPYSRSKSHMRLIEAIYPFRNHVHEIILTSPIALVPRELEDTYPPRFYDIPVTGQWYEEEKNQIEGILKEYVRRNNYKHIIFFLPEDMKFVEDFGISGHFVPWKKHESNEFEDLLDILRKITEDKKHEKRDFLKEKMIAIADYQFGSWISTYTKDMKVTRMFNQFMLTLDGKPYFIFNEDMGKLTIHRDASWIFLKEGKWLVEIDDFKPTANIYAMGVRDCSEQVRQGDEVVIHHNGEARGVGTARMSAEMMKMNERGIAVKVRN